MRLQILSYACLFTGAFVITVSMMTAATSLYCLYYTWHVSLTTVSRGRDHPFYVWRIEAQREKAMHRRSPSRQAVGRVWIHATGCSASVPATALRWLPGWHIPVGWSFPHCMASETSCWVCNGGNTHRRNTCDRELGPPSCLWTNLSCREGAEKGKRWRCNANW